MSYELYVYAPIEDEPPIDEISALLDVADWQWVLVTDLHSLEQSSNLHNSIAVGWDLADDIGDSVEKAVAEENPELLSAPVDMLNAVEIEVESPFVPDPEVISELRESDINPDLVSRVEDAVACYAFRVDGDVTEQTVEFIWALASAVGVLTDGVLEDVEDGALLDCNDIEG
jgi:hypothetical protein